MAGVDLGLAQAILENGDWVWLRKQNSDGSSKDWAIRIIAQGSQAQLERRWGKSIRGRRGQSHQENTSQDAVLRAIGLIEKKGKESYRLHGGSSDLTDVYSGMPAQQRSETEPTEISTGPVGEVYASFFGAGKAAFDDLAEALVRAAEEVREAMEGTGERVPELVLGSSQYSSAIVMFDRWVFAINRDPDKAAAHANRVELKGDPSASVRGSAILDESATPVAVLLWLARARYLMTTADVRVEFVDDNGRELDGTLRNESEVLGAWGTDFEKLRPALEKLELVEKRIDLRSVQAPVADDWF